jgi:hypothetical protein
VEKAHVVDGAEIKSLGSGTGEWPLRERLLAFILGPISLATNEELSWEELKKLLWSDSGLRSEIKENLKHPLISRKQILGSVPDPFKEPVREFLGEFLITGGNMPC